MADNGIGQAIGAIGGAFVNASSANVQNKKQFGYQSALQAQAAKLNYDYSLKSLENNPSYQRRGLESAGYNPMLAVQNSTSGSNSSWTSAGQAQSADFSSAISQGVANAQSFQRLKNESNVSASQVKLNEATAENQASMASNNIKENHYIDDKRKAEISNLQGDTMLKEAQIDNMEKQIELGQMGITVQQAANANQAERNRILEKSMPSGRSQSFANYTQGIRNIFGGIGDIMHGYNETNNYNGSNESETVYYDKNGNVRGSVSHRGKNKGNSHKSRKRR